MIKFKNGMLWGTLAMGLATAGSVLAAEPDLNRLNPLLQAIANEVLAGDDLLQGADAVFDPAATQFEDEKLAYEVNASIPLAPWGGATQFVARTQMQSKRGPVKNGIQADLSVTARTDVLALARHAATIALAKSDGHAPAFEARILGNLRRAQTVSSLSELSAILSDGQTLAIEILESQIAGERTFIECLRRLECGSPRPDPTGVLSPDYTSLASSEQSIQTRLRIRDSYRATAIRLADDSITVVGLSPAGFLSKISLREGMDIQSAQVTLSSTQLTAKIAAFFEVKTDKLDRLKADLLSALSGVENGLVTEPGKVRDAYRSSLTSFKNVLRGLNRY